MYGYYPEWVTRRFCREIIMGIELPNQITDLAKGADLSVAGKLGALKNGIANQTVVLQKMEQSLQNLKLLQDTTGLPSVPDVLAIQGQAANLQGLLNTKLQELNSLPGGACLAGALNSVSSIANDGYGFVSAQVEAAIAAAGVPADLLDISGLYSQSREMTASLGLDKVVGGLLGELGCLADGTGATAELESLMGQLGMNPSGQVSDADFQASMISDLKARAGSIGIDTSYFDSAADSLGEVSKMANDAAAQAKTAAAAQITAAKQAIKDAVPKIPSPPSIW